MTEKDFSTINWARTWRKWQNESIGAIIYFLVNIVDIVLYSFLAYAELWIVMKLSGGDAVTFLITISCVWVGTFLAMGNCILRKLENLPEDIELERKDKENQ